MPETVNQGQTNESEQKTFTQDELNAILNDRLKREREKHADYAALKEREYDRLADVQDKLNSILKF